MNKNMNAPVALIDLDGTVADYDGSLRTKMELIRDPEREPPYVGRAAAHEEEPAWIERRRKLIQSQPGFWRDLTPIPEGLAIVSIMREIGYNLHVLTKGPSSTNSAWTEKKDWCDKHLPDAAVTVGMDKSMMYGRVLFDDYPPYFLPWLEHRPRGVVICLAHSWNAEYARGELTHATHPRVFRYDGSNVDTIRKALQLAFDRRIDAREDAHRIGYVGG